MMVFLWVLLALLSAYAVGTVVFIAAIWRYRDPSLKGIDIPC